MDGVEQPLTTTFSTAFPSAVEKVPAADASGVPTSDSRISIVFDNPLDAAAAVEPANIDLLWEATPVDITSPSYAEDSLTLSFEPVGGLIAGSNYSVRIDGAVGGPLRQAIGDFQWRFTTRLPFLASTIPQSGAEGISTARPTIQMFFSDPIASQNPRNFQLFEQRLDRGPGSGPEPGSAAPRVLVPITGFGAEGDTVISFSPQGGLRPNAKYTVRISRNVLGPLAAAGDSLVFRTAGRLENAASGGLVANPGRSVEIYFPPNALDAAVEVVIRRLPNEQVPGKALVQEPRRVSPAFLVDAGGATLRKSVTLGMRFHEDDPGTVESARLAIFRLLDDDSWERIGGTAQAGEPVLRAAVESLGTFAVFEDLDAPVGKLIVRDLDCQPRAFSPSDGAKRETDISFTLTGPADVTVRVYNASGRLERVIEPARPLGQGQVLLTWDGQDQNGETVVSGLYIVVVRAGDAQQEKVVAVVP